MSGALPSLRASIPSSICGACPRNVVCDEKLIGRLLPGCEPPEEIVSIISNREWPQAQSQHFRTDLSILAA